MTEKRTSESEKNGEPVEVKPRQLYRIVFAADVVAGTQQQAENLAMSYRDKLRALKGCEEAIWINARPVSDNDPEDQLEAWITERYKIEMSLMISGDSLLGEFIKALAADEAEREAEDLLEQPLLAQCAYIMRIYDGDVAAAKLAIEEALS